GEGARRASILADIFGLWPRAAWPLPAEIYLVLEVFFPGGNQAAGRRMSSRHAQRIKRYPAPRDLQTSPDRPRSKKHGPDAQQRMSVALLRAEMRCRVGQFWRTEMKTGLFLISTALAGIAAAPVHAQSDTGAPIDDSAAAA